MISVNVHQGLYRLFDLEEVALCKRSNDELHALIDPPFMDDLFMRTKDLQWHQLDLHDLRKRASQIGIMPDGLMFRPLGDVSWEVY